MATVPHATFNSNLGSKWRRTLHSHTSREEAETTGAWKKNRMKMPCLCRGAGDLYFLLNPGSLSPAAAAGCEAGRPLASDLEGQAPASDYRQRCRPSFKVSSPRSEQA